MRRINLDARDWRSEDDLWRALLDALGAPEWHGRNIDALWETVTEVALEGVEPADAINRVQPPFEIYVRGTEGLPGPLTQLLVRIAKLLKDAQAEGVQASLQLPHSLRRSAGL